MSDTYLSKKAYNELNEKLGNYIGDRDSFVQEQNKLLDEKYNAEEELAKLQDNLEACKKEKQQCTKEKNTWIEKFDNIRKMHMDESDQLEKLKELRSVCIGCYYMHILKTKQVLSGDYVDTKLKLKDLIADIKKKKTEKERVVLNDIYNWLETIGDKNFMYMYNIAGNKK